jgi:hypothetical protein
MKVKKGFSSPLFLNEDEEWSRCLSMVILGRPPHLWQEVKAVFYSRFHHVFSPLGRMKSRIATFSPFSNPTGGENVRTDKPANGVLDRRIGCSQI